MKKVCEKCNTDNDLYAEKCAQCGNDFYKNIKPVNKKSKKFLIFGVIIPSILVFIYFILLYSYLYGFQNYNPEVYLDEYIQLLQDNNYNEIIKINEYKETYFNGDKEFIQYLNNKYGNVKDKVKIIKNSKMSTDNKIVYDVQFGKGNINNITLLKTDRKKLLYFDTWKVDKPEKNLKYKKDIKIFCYKDIEVKLNNKLVTDDYKESCKKIELFNNVLDNNFNKPELICYNISDILDITSISAKMPTGEECEVIDNKDGTYIVKSVMNNDIKKDIESLTIEVGKKYAAYIAEDYTFRDLKKYLYKDTQFYNTLLEFYNGWFPLHNSFKYENVIVEDMEWYSNICCSSNIKFDYVITYKNNRVRKYDISYKIYFTKINDKWLVSNITNY